MVIASTTFFTQASTTMFTNTGNTYLTGLTAPNLVYVGGAGLLDSVATGTVSAGSSAITVTAGRAAIGGALAIDCATSGSGQNGCLSSTDWSTFNNKQAALSGGVNGMVTAWSGASTIVATGTPTMAAFNATSTATSSISGDLVMQGNSYLLLSTTSASQSSQSLPEYGRLPGDIIDARWSGTGIASLNAFNPTPGACNGSGFYADGDATSSVSDYGLFFFANTKFTGMGCSVFGFNFSTVKPEDTVILAPTGGVVIAAATTTENMKIFRIQAGGSLSSTSTVEMMSVFNWGALTFGTTTPGFALATIGTSTRPQLALSDNIAADNLWTIRNAGGSLFIATSTVTATSSGTAVMIDGSGTAAPGLFVGTSTNANATIAFAGRGFWSGLTASAGLQTGIVCLNAANELINESVACVASSLRFKERVQPLNVGLSELMRLRPVSFYFKPSYNGALQNNANYNGEQVGFIAEDVQALDPRLSVVESDGVTAHGVRYEQMTALLTKAVQELNQKVDDLVIGKVQRSVEENWQDIFIVLLLLYVGYNEWSKRRT